MAARLVEVVGGKAGTEEELVGVFVALCRAVGLLVRTLKVLHPAPLKPTQDSMVPEPSSLNVP